MTHIIRKKVTYRQQSGLVVAKIHKLLMGVLLFSSILLISCGRSHNAAVYDGGKLPTPVKQITGVVDVTVAASNRTVSGSATCSKFLIFTLSSPSSIAYGYNLQTEAGIKGGDCIGGAVYEAINGKADYLIGAKYDVKTTEILCIFGFCLFSSIDVAVTGYPGIIEKINVSGATVAPAPTYQSNPFLQEIGNENSN